MSHPKPTEYNVKNKSKYIGDKNPVCRSSWETHMCKMLDRNENVCQWGSEVVIVEYYNPVKNRKARYYTDFIVEFIDINDNKVIEVLEIKPLKESVCALLLMEHQKNLLVDKTAVMPIGVASKSKNQKSRAYQNATTMTNAAKWLAAEQFCKSKGWNFKVLTEKQLFGRLK